ncbi:MAG: sulfite exporter TauE/SafE family protein [Proteobacteria bacterium]|nr:sulfite exporter TauE/SafE family protein [Pseudomonadota bacterium]
MTYFRKSALWIGLVLLFFAVAGPYAGIVPKTALVIFGLCFTCELIDSGLGMGYGTILTPALMFMGFSPWDIVPTLLLSELLSGFTAAFFHNEVKNVDLGWGGKDLKPALILACGSVVGVVAGVSLALTLPQDLLRMLIGCIILMSGLFVILLSRHLIVYKHWKMLVLSATASFNKAISGGGYGPLVTSGQILSGVKGKSAVGITSFAEAFTCLLAASVFIAQGGYVNVRLLVPMCAGALISVPFSVFAIQKSNENQLKIVIGVLTLAMGGLTIFKALQLY